MGVFIGSFDEHASSVGIICNLHTNTVSAQFHSFYDFFLNSDYTSDKIPVTSAFHDLFRLSRENHYDPEDVRHIGSVNALILTA